MKSFQQFNEDLEARRKHLAKKQKEHLDAFTQRSLAAANAQKERIAKQIERENLKREIKQELQTEQVPTMEPNYYSQQVARRQAAQKTAHIKHVHGELGASARAQEAAKRERLKSIMSR